MCVRQTQHFFSQNVEERTVVVLVGTAQDQPITQEPLQRRNSSNTGTIVSFSKRALGPNVMAVCVCVSHSSPILVGSQRKGFARIPPLIGLVASLFWLYQLDTLPIDPSQTMPSHATFPGPGIARKFQAEKRRGCRQHARPSPPIAPERPSRGKEGAQFL